MNKQTNKHEHKTNINKHKQTNIGDPDELIDPHRNERLSTNLSPLTPLNEWKEKSNFQVVNLR